jgi:hypothetical protein
MKKFIFALAALLGLASCNIERDLSFVVQEMMNIQGGMLVNDLGVRYSVSAKDASDIFTNQRVFMTGTAEPAEASGYDYVLTPYEWYGVLVKDCVKLSTVEDVDETLGTCPVSLDHVWFQGGFINALTTVSFDMDEEDKPIEVNMLFDDVRSTGNDLYFILKNKQGGRTWEDDTLSPEKVIFGGQFLSFRYEDYVQPGFKGELAFHLEWKWFDANPYSDEYPYRTVTVRQEYFTITVE